LLILCWPFVCVPCCFDDYKDVVHYCSSCGFELQVVKY